MSSLATSQNSLQVLNPATAEPFAEVTKASSSDVDCMAIAAHKAFTDWSPRTDRAALLEECAKALRAQSIKLASTLTSEQGKPLKESIEELMGASHWLRSISEFNLQEDEIIQLGSSYAHVTRQPIGVVGAITPWNYPILLSIWKIAPALLAGNCVILKPSSHTPLTIQKIVKLFSEVLPIGVLQIAHGGDDIGKALVAHPLVKHISLTGSTKAGRSVGSQVGHDLKTSTLELGGNDPAIVLEDADIEKSAAAIFSNAFKNCGQTCMAIKRVYIQQDLFAAFAEAISTLAKELVVGNGLEKTTQMGPLNNERQITWVEKLLSDATTHGGSILAGGQRIDSPGYFLEPTIITGLSEARPLVAEEQFGPLLPLLEFSDLDDAVLRANATPYGLGASIWTQDTERASNIASRLDCGTTWINQHSTTDPAVPFGGTKDSGLGYANGQIGLEEFTRVKVSYNP